MAYIPTQDWRYSSSYRVETADRNFFFFKNQSKHWTNFINCGLTYSKHAELSLHSPILFNWG